MPNSAISDVDKHPTVGPMPAVGRPGYRSEVFETVRRGVAKFGLAICLPVLALVVWEVMARAGLLNSILLSKPSSIWSDGLAMLGEGTLGSDFISTLVSTAIGFGLAMVIGIALGAVMGLWERADLSINPLVIAAYNAPIVAFYPLIIIWFGLSQKGIVFMSAFFAVIPVIINTQLGVKLVDRAAVLAARAFDASFSERIRYIVLPGSVPAVAAGARLAIGRAFVGTIVAEMFIGQRGLGYEIVYYAGFLQMGRVFAAVIIIAAVGGLTVGGATLIERRLLTRFSAVDS